LEKREWKKEVGLISIFRHLVSKPASAPKTQFPASSRASIYVVR